MSKKDIGFSEPTEEHDKIKLEQVTMSAAKSKFSPEFMNRIQNVVTFHNLTPEQLEHILELELNAVRDRLLRIDNDKLERRFDIAVSPSAKKRLLAEGFSKEYGARHLKRAITNLVQRPLAKLVNSSQITAGDTVIVDDTGSTTFDFYIHPTNTVWRTEQ